MTLNGVMTVILRYFTEFGSFRLYFLPQKCNPKNLVFSDVSLITIFAEVTENKCIMGRHMRNVDKVRYLLLIYSDSYRFVELKSLVSMRIFGYGANLRIKRQLSTCSAFQK